MKAPRLAVGLLAILFLSGCSMFYGKADRRANFTESVSVDRAIVHFNAGIEELRAAEVDSENKPQHVAEAEKHFSFAYEWLDAAKNLFAAQQERHGVSETVIPQDDKEGLKKVYEQVGAYKSGTRTWNFFQMIGQTLFAPKTWLSVLVPYLPAIFGSAGGLGLLGGLSGWLMARAKRKQAEEKAALARAEADKAKADAMAQAARAEKAEVAGLEAVDNLIDLNQKGGKVYDATGEGTKELRDATKPLASIYQAQRKAN